MKQEDCYEFQPYFQKLHSRHLSLSFPSLEACSRLRHSTAVGAQLVLWTCLADSTDCSSPQSFHYCPIIALLLFQALGF